MRGFQPQKFADGGLVQGLKRAFGMDEERNARVAAYRAQAAQEAAQNQQQAAPAPAPAPAVSDYMGMGAMKRREKAAGLKDGGTVKPRGFKAGGLIRGPGTGTSDSIETEKRPGTFIMPADSTQAIGPEALEELGEVGDSATEEQGESVPVRLSNGEFELPPEQVQALGESVLTVMRDATHRPVRGFAPEAQPEEPRQFFANGGLVQDDEKRPPGFSPSNVASKAAGFVAGAFPNTTAAVKGAMQDARDAYQQGGLGAAVGQSARVAVTPLIGLADDVATSTARAIDPAANALKTLVTGDATPIGQAPVAGPTAKTASTPPPSPAPSVQAGPATVAAAPAVEPTAAPAGQPLAAGSVSAQNNAAADALSAPRVAGFVPGGGGTGLPSQVAAPVVRNSTNDWAARNAIRSAQVSASSITNDPSRIGARAAALSPDNVAYQAALKNDQALQQGQLGLDQEALRQNGGIQREQVQQSGANQRSARGFEIDRQRVDVESRRAEGEAAVRGFQVREAGQKEALRNVLLDPNATPEQRKVAQRSLSALSGKTAADRMQTVNLPDTVTDQGVVAKGGQALVRTLEDGTVERVPIAGQGIAPKPSANHLKMLKENPGQAALFDEIYGTGAAKRYLG